LARTLVEEEPHPEDHLHMLNKSEKRERERGVLS